MSEVYEVVVKFNFEKSARFYAKSLERKGREAEVRKVNPDAQPVADQE